MLVEKEIIRPGVYWYVNEAGFPARLDATPEKVKHYHDSGKKMLAAGLSIPVPLEHDKTAHPLTPAEKLLNNAGFVKDYLMKPIKDEDTGQMVDAMFGKIDVPNPKIAAALPHTIKWTSPWITSFVDGNKNAWNEVIGHVALTTRPRITKQQPFPSVGMAMSHAATLPGKPVDASYAVSRAGLLRADGAAFKPMYPMAFSLLSGIALDAEGMKKTGSTPPDKKAESEKGGDVEPSSGNPDMGNPEESLIDADGDISVYDVLCDLLESEGYTVPEGTTADNFAERMYSVFMDKLKSKANPMDPQTPAPGNTPPPKPPVIQEQPPLYMSLEQAQAIADPVMRGLALSLVEQNKKIAALQNNALEFAKSRRQERITKLARWLPLDAKNKLLEQSASMQFSMSDNGVVTDQMATTLDILEAGMREIPTLLQGDARFTVQEHPQEYGNEVAPERVEAVTNELLKRLPEETVKPVPKPSPENIRHMAG